MWDVSLIKRFPIPTIVGESSLSSRGNLFDKIPPRLPFVWGALGVPDERKPHQHARRFRLAIDTGCNQNVAIRQEDMVAIFGAKEDVTDLSGRNTQHPLISSSRGSYYNLQLNLFLLRGEIEKNESGRKDLIPDDSKFVALQLDHGIQVFVPPKDGEQDARPTFPLLGTRAFMDNELRFGLRGGIYSVGKASRFWSWIPGTWI